MSFPCSNSYLSDWRFLLLALHMILSYHILPMHIILHYTCLLYLFFSTTYIVPPPPYVMGMYVDANTYPSNTCGGKNYTTEKFHWVKLMKVGISCIDFEEKRCV